MNDLDCLMATDWTCRICSATHAAPTAHCRRCGATVLVFARLAAAARRLERDGQVETARMLTRNQ